MPLPHSEPREPISPDAVIPPLAAGDLTPDPTIPHIIEQTPLGPDATQPYPLLDDGTPGITIPRLELTADELKELPYARLWPKRDKPREGEDYFRMGYVGGAFPPEREVITTPTRPPIPARLARSVVSATVGIVKAPVKIAGTTSTIAMSYTPRGLRKGMSAKEIKARKKLGIANEQAEDDLTEASQAIQNTTQNQLTQVDTRESRLSMVARRLGNLTGRTLQRIYDSAEQREEQRIAEREASIPYAIRSVNTQVTALVDQAEALDNEAELHDQGLDVDGQPAKLYVGYDAGIKRNKADGLIARVDSLTAQKDRLTQGKVITDSSTDVTAMVRGIGRVIKGGNLRVRTVGEKLSDLAAAGVRKRAATLDQRSLTGVGRVINTKSYVSPTTRLKYASQARTLRNIADRIDDTAAARRGRPVATRPVVTPPATPAQAPASPVRQPKTTAELDQEAQEWLDQQLNAKP